MSRVVFNNVTKIYAGGVIAIRNASLTVEDKQFVVLVGPSGSGKSTLLRMIAGLEEVTEGEIYIDNKLINDVEPKDRDIAMVFQNYALYPHMTVYKNMAFGLKLRKYPKEEISKRVNEAAEILRINHLLNRKPKALSGGERQRVAVGRAIVRHPKVFLFDEPLSNLDAKLRVQMRTEIKKLHQSLQATMIYVTHDQTEAMTMGDIIVVLNEGAIQQIAEPLTLYQKPTNQFVAGFIGSPPMNFLAGKIVRENRDLFFQSDSFSIKVDASTITILEQYAKNQVVFGIRPEDIHTEGALFEKRTNALIHTQVDVVEPLGSEILLYLMVGKHQLVAKVNSYITPSINTSLPVVFDIKKAHFFAGNSGEAII